tara:strand:+ start:409 stop:1938 length:1530 start_codon:yes stop_codon:yes gene_type:complete
MSYRNPQIIQDRSGEILAKGFSQAAESIAQGITTLGVQRRKEREKRELEDKQFNKDLITLSNEKAKNAAIFNKGLKGVSESMRQEMLKANEDALQKIYEIKKAQLSGDSDPALADELARQQMKITGYNEMVEAGIGATTGLNEAVDNYEECGRTIFLANGKDGTKDESRTLFFAWGGAEGYERGFRYENGDMVAYARKIGEGNKEYVIPRSEFSERMLNLTKQMDNVEVNASERVAQGFFQDEGKGKDLLTTISVDNKVEFETNEAGEKRRIEKQYFDTEFIDAQKLKSFNEIEADLDSVDGDSQQQQFYLDTLLIDYTPEGWQELGDEEKAKILNDVNDTIFNNRTKIKQGSDGRYYRELKNTLAKDDKPSGSGGFKFAAQYTDAEINKMVNNLVGKVEKAETIDVKDLLNISSGMEALSGPKYNVNVIEGRVKEGTGTEDVPAEIEDTGTYITITESLPGDNKDLVNVYDITNASSLTNLILRTQGYGAKNRVKARQLANAIIAKQN